jgi:hypothetical protein
LALGKGFLVWGLALGLALGCLQELGLWSYLGWELCLVLELELPWVLGPEQGLVVELELELELVLELEQGLVLELELELELVLGLGLGLV